MLDVFGDVAIGLQFLKGNCGSRMGLETVAQNSVGAAALLGWQEQRGHSLGKKCCSRVPSSDPRHH